MAAAVLLLQNNHILSQTDIVGHSRAPLSPSPHGRRTKERELNKGKKERKRRYIFYGGPGPLSSPSLSSPSPSSSPWGVRRDHPPHPRVPEEGQDCEGGSLVSKHSSYRGAPRPLPLAQPLDPLPHHPRPEGPSLAPGDEVEPGLTLAAVASPALVRVNPADLVMKIRPNRCMA